MQQCWTIFLIEVIRSRECCIVSVINPSFDSMCNCGHSLGSWWIGASRDAVSVSLWSWHDGSRTTFSVRSSALKLTCEAVATALRAKLWPQPFVCAKNSEQSLDGLWIKSIANHCPWHYDDPLSISAAVATALGVDEREIQTSVGQSGDYEWAINRGVSEVNFNHVDNGFMYEFIWCFQLWKSLCVRVHVHACIWCLWVLLCVSVSANMVAHAQTCMLCVYVPLFVLYRVMWYNSWSNILHLYSCATNSMQHSGPACTPVELSRCNILDLSAFLWFSSDATS